MDVINAPGSYARPDSQGNKKTGAILDNFVPKETFALAPGLPWPNPSLTA